jgi:hypothetical protein
MTSADRATAQTADRGWWTSPLVQWLAILATGLPICFTHLPPLNDLFDHLASYHVELNRAGSAVLQRDWSLRWAMMGNLGVDLAIVPFAKLFGLERAIWLIAALLPPLTAWGFFRAASAVHGEVPAPAYFALPLAFAFPYQYGFLNFCLGIALAFHLFAFWVRSERFALPARLGGLLAAAVIAWVVHTYGWAILCVLVGCYELSRSRRILTVAAHTWPLLAPVVPMLVWKSGSHHHLLHGWFMMRGKAVAIQWLLRDQSQIFDELSVVALICALVAALRVRGARVSGGLGWAALALGILFAILPREMFHSGYADIRLAPIALATALLAVDVRLNRRAAASLAAAGLALLALRVGVSAEGMRRYDREMGSHLRALDHVAPGSKVAALVAWPCDKAWRTERTEHLAAMALVRRDAFVNTHWNIEGSEPVAPIGGLGTPFNDDPSQFVSDPTCRASWDYEMRGQIIDREETGPLVPQLAGRIAAVPQDRFGYVWVFGFDPRTLPAFAGWAPVYADAGSVLYRSAGATR